MLSRSHSSVEDLHSPSAHVIQPQSSTLTASPLPNFSLLKPQIGSYSMNALKKKQAKANTLTPSSSFKLSESKNDKKFLTQRLKLPIAEADSYRNTPSIGTASGGTSRRTDKTSPRITLTKGKEMSGSLSYRARKSEVPFLSGEKPALVIRKSGSEANNMKLDFSKVANKAKETIDVTHSNRSIFLIKKLEQLLQKLKSQKEDLQAYVKPRTARPSQATMERDGFSHGVLALITTRGYNMNEDDIFMRTFTNCENEWRVFAEEVTKVLSISTKRKAGTQASADSERKSDISSDLLHAMKLDNMYDIVDCIDESSEMKLSARELIKFQEDLKKQKAKIDEELEKQMSERKNTEENMDSFLRKLLEFQTNFNSKAEKLHVYVESARNTDIWEENSQGDIQQSSHIENESFSNHIAHQSCTNSTSSAEPREEKRPDTRIRMVLGSSSLYEGQSFSDNISSRNEIIEENHGRKRLNESEEERELEDELEQAKQESVKQENMELYDDLEKTNQEVCPQEAEPSSSGIGEKDEEMTKEDLINRITFLEEQLRNKSSTDQAGSPKEDENQRLIELLEERESSLRDLRRENEAIKAETTRIAEKAGAIKNKIFGAALLAVDPLEMQIRREIDDEYLRSTQTEEEDDYVDSRAEEEVVGSESFDRYEEEEGNCGGVTQRGAGDNKMKIGNLVFQKNDDDIGKTDNDGLESFRRKSSVASRGEY